MLHDNSLAAFEAARDAGVFSDRHKMILRTLRDFGPLTDRGIQRVLGFSERGSVQPRISDLVKAGVVREVGRTTEELTGKRVRLVALNGPTA